MKRIITLARLGISVAAIFIITLVISPPAYAGVVVSGPDDVFYSIARLPNGGIRIVGTRLEQAGYFTFLGTNYTFTPLRALLSGGVAVAQRITSDGNWIIGYSESLSTDVGYEATRWNVNAPDSPIGLGFLGGTLKDSLGYGIGIQGGSIIVVGASSYAGGTIGFKWTSSGGMTSLPLTGLPSVASAATGISANGDVWTGNEDPSGPNSFRAVVGNSSGVSVLDSMGNQFTVANDISRDGTIVVGNIGQQAAFWSGPAYAATLITLNGTPLLGTAKAADKGLVVGSANGRGWICSINDGKAKYIEDWLRDNFGFTVDHAVVSVNDISVDGNNVYLALQGSGILVQGRLIPTIEMLPPQDGTIRFRFSSDACVTYQLVSSTTLPAVTWQPVVGSSVVGDGSVKELTASVDGPVRYYRLLIQ